MYDFISMSLSNLDEEFVKTHKDLDLLGMISAIYNDNLITSEEYDELEYQIAETMGKLLYY